MKKQSTIQPGATFGDLHRITENTSLDLQLVRWLIWLPLQRAEELARCSGMPLPTVYNHLATLEEKRLIESVTFSEQENAHHRRYHVTDLGLYTFAEQSNPPSDVKHLAQSYQVRERDLLVGILHPLQVMYITDMASKLIEEGRHTGYHLSHIQQPACMAYRDQGRKHTFTADVAMHLQRIDGETQAFYLLVDVWEQVDTQHSQQRAWLNRLLDLCEAGIWHNHPIPCPLIITHPHRLFTWGNLLQQARQDREIRLPRGGITTSVQDTREIYDPIWWPLNLLATWSDLQGGTQNNMNPPLASCVSVPSFFEKQKKQQAERAPGAYEQQKESLRLRRVPRQGAYPSPERHLARYVKGDFMDQAEEIQPADLLVEHLEGPDFVRQYALLTLRLTAHEKGVVSLLGRFPLLSIPDLSMLLTPEASEARSTEISINSLLHLGLVETREWPNGRKRAEKVRYILTETAIRYLIERNNIPPVYYLTQQQPQDGPSATTEEITWVQRSLAGLETQMDHTIGVYRCMVGVHRHAYDNQTPSILWWKSARESARWYRDQEENRSSVLRPDGEVCYQTPESETYTTLLIEYDRATTRTRDYTEKFTSYQSYYLATGFLPPPILLITQNRKTAEKIRGIVNNIEKRLNVIIVLEEDLLRDGIMKSSGSPL
jgi:DNA-binding transcriptional ArsR family regulator